MAEKKQTIPNNTNAGNLRERIRDPEERRRLLRLRVQSLAGGSLDVYADAQVASALWKNLLLLGGVAPEADEEIGPAVYAAAVLDQVRVFQRSGGGEEKEEKLDENCDVIERLIQDRGGVRKKRFVPEIKDAMPEPLVWVAGKDGAVISEGTVCLLSGEGGVAKTTLSLQIALHIAHRHRVPVSSNGHGRERYESEAADLALRECAGLTGVGGPVLFASYEDPDTVCAWRLKRLAERLDAEDPPRQGLHVDALKNISVLDLSGRPLYGPPEGGTYSQRPVALSGWIDLKRAVKEAQPRLIIIDPALGAYVSEANGPAPVREFLDALGGMAKEHDAGVLLLAHSTKAARRSTDRYDPGHIGGSGAWHDGVRGAMVLARERSEDGQSMGHQLRILKANYGPSFIQADLEPRRANADGTGAILGFSTEDGFYDDFDKGEGKQLKRPNGGGVEGTAAEATDMDH